LGCHNLTYNSNLISQKVIFENLFLKRVFNLVSDRKIGYCKNINAQNFYTIIYYTPDVISHSDYLPFGQVMPNRHGNDNQYRYGFNGHEKDDEIAGGSNHLSWGDFGMDPRIGRRWQIDPQANKLPGQSPYSVNNNSPIYLHDPDGKFAIPPALVAGALGAVSEVISQLGINVFGKGMSIPEAFYNLDKSDIAVAAGSAAFFGFFDGGISNFTNFISKSGNRKILKLTAQYVIESVIGTVENLVKDYANDPSKIDVGAAIGGALIEAGLGEFLPSGKFFEKQAKNAKKTMNKMEDKMSRSSFEKLGSKKQSKIKNKYDKAKSEYHKNTIMQRTVESISDGSAKAAGNSAQEYIKNKNEGATIEYNTKTGEQKAY
jgi:hypothetical protein